MLSRLLIVGLAKYLISVLNVKALVGYNRGLLCDCENFADDLFAALI